jgi:hypothetical protein
MSRHCPAALRRRSLNGRIAEMRVECPYSALSDGVERFVSTLPEHLSCAKTGLYAAIWGLWGF